jgi:hypothetical protein
MPGVPYTFGNATTSIPLTQLDANFNTTATLGNTAIGLGNVTTSVGNLTLTNVNIVSGTSNLAAGNSTAIVSGTSNVVVVSSGGNVTVATNNAEQMRITTAGDVGIGTTAPGAKLDVTGQVLVGTTGNNAIAINSSGANYGFISNPSSGVFALGYGGTIGTLGTSVATWNSSGNFAFNSGYGSAATAYGCRAWVNYNGTGASIRGSGNVSSVTNNGTGDNTINFSTAMPDANFSWAVTQQLNGTGNADTGASSSARTQGTSAWGTGFVRILTMANTNLSQENPLVLSVQIFR